MFAGIFAAGEGSRLRKTHPGIIKPMVPVSGRPLIEWTVRLLAEAGVSDVTILLNSRGGMVPGYLEKTFSGAVRFHFILQDTASSWESFRLVSRALALKAESFLMSTVDAFYEPVELRKFSVSYGLRRPDAVLGITDSIADEKPLWVDVEEGGKIVRIGPGCVQKKYATSGVYLMSRGLAADMPAAARHGALREYLAEVAGQGRRVWSCPMPKSVDVDDSSDLALAEEFVAGRLDAAGKTQSAPGARYSGKGPC